jgi:hypothetical protein
MEHVHGAYPSHEVSWSDFYRPRENLEMNALHLSSTRGGTYLKNYVFWSQVASKCQSRPMVETRTKPKVEKESTLLSSSVPQDQLWVSQKGKEG